MSIQRQQECKLLPFSTALQGLPQTRNITKYDQIYRMIGISPRSLRQISHTARNRGFDPALSLIIKDAYVEDAKRSGRPEISEKVIAPISDEYSDACDIGKPRLKAAVEKEG